MNIDGQKQTQIHLKLWQLLDQAQNQTECVN